MATVKTYEGLPQDSLTTLDKLVPNTNGYYGGEYNETLHREEGGGYPEWRAEAAWRAAERFRDTAAQLGVEVCSLELEVVAAAA